MNFRFTLWSSALLLFMLLLDVTIISGKRSTATMHINEFMPNPESGNEWVELYNPNPFDVDLSGWTLHDNTTEGNHTAIDAGVIVPAHSLLVISLTSAMLNNSSADAVQLLDLDGYVVSYRGYDRTTKGASYACIPDGSDDCGFEGLPTAGMWNQAQAPTTISPEETVTAIATATLIPSPTETTPTNTATVLPTSTPYPQGLIINEFMPAPEQGSEWVELYNSASTSAIISGWLIDDGSGGQSPYVLPEGSYIEPGGFLVVELSSNILNNSGDVVQLLRPD
ncbi:MAG: hypothetical protein GFH27_549297n167 [Chloroflexi bacterium AL-W]|nr:hypothetical protein [Chloroflexi bacterium AL-N1]NOK68979.1 hypothetical protein [Chloroflexi bacterium AL-N10]NOK76962.1 hypothetical protein [Chloroflexi bacterium AL-N5]NOK82650.1 hypothetical protein [Chloroflexi bacterium AL-W]NOK90819.1 hypothetical protein [Chloroflexi bacterium AL-N15]